MSHLTARKDSFKNPRTKEKYSTCINRVQDAGLNRSIYEIRDEWIKTFSEVLKAHGNNANTRSKYLTAIGSVFREAKRKGLINVNPFEGLKKNLTPSKKAKLGLEEFRRIQHARFTGKMEIVRRLFVFATLARGMRAFDVLTLEWGNIVGDRLVYQAQKAGVDQEGKRFDIRIIPVLMECLEGLDSSKPYVFPLVSQPKKLYKKDPNRYLKHTDSVLTRVKKTLKQIALDVEIDKNISMHVARHTFAFLSDQANIPLGTIQQLLGHGDITTTKI